MSVGLTKTKRRIVSVSNTEKITKAMEMVSTVKLKRFRDAKEKGSYFASEFALLMGLLFDSDKPTGSHYGRVNKKSNKTLHIVISSNLGLCGAYNTNLYKYVRDNVLPEDEICPIGEKGARHFIAEGKLKIADYGESNLSLSMDASSIYSFCRQLKDDFNAGKYRRIVIIYTHYINSISFVPTSFQLLPVQIPRKKREDESYCPPLFDGTPRELIHELMPSYLFAIFLDRLNESQLSEQASRRTAMDNANDNAEALIEKLSVEYNKARQNAITQEITEVVGGANAGN